MNNYRNSEYPWTEWVFEYKNKNYGAYTIRQHSGERDILSLIIALLLMICFILLFQKINDQDISESIDRVLTSEPHVLDVLVDDVPKVIEFSSNNATPVVEKLSSEIQTAALTDPKVIDSNTEELTSSIDLNFNNIISNHPAEMALSGNSTTIGELNGNGSGTVELNLEKLNAPVDFAENMPEFPGGFTALQAFIRNNLKYPSIAIENEIEGTVLISFIVHYNGEILSPMVMRSVNEVCDLEAIRVIKSMPKWKPGMINGKAVSVKYTLPFRYVLK